MWKNIKTDGIAKIEKRVAVFDVWELRLTPYARFQVKIMESADGVYTGYTNIQVKDKTGDYCGAVGDGDTIEDALKETIARLMNRLSTKEVWEESEFTYTDPADW